MYKCKKGDFACPCKVEMDGEYYCDFARVLVLLDLQGKDQKYDELIGKLCPKVREELLNHDYITEQLQRIEKDFLSKVKIGERVFCTMETDDVIFLEKPKRHLGKCVYQNTDGKIRKGYAHCFRLISNGSKSARYQFKEKEPKWRIDYITRIARRAGFRAEKKKVGNSYLLTIWGDTQEAVDNFIIDACKNDFILDYY